MPASPLGLIDEEGEADIEADREADGDALMDADIEADKLAEIDGEADSDALIEGDGLADRLALIDAEGEAPAPPMSSRRIAQNRTAAPSVALRITLSPPVPDRSM